MLQIPFQLVLLAVFFEKSARNQQKRGRRSLQGLGAVVREWCATLRAGLRDLGMSTGQLRN
jgi:hypothetical protein